MSIRQIYLRVRGQVARFLRPRGQRSRAVEMIVLLASSAMAACAITAPEGGIDPTRTKASTETPYVVATAYAAKLVGVLTEENGCLQVKSSQDSAAFTLAWPPDAAVVVDGEEVKVTTGIVRGQPETVVLHLGDTVLVGGGESATLNDPLLATVGEGCPGRYWIVGFTVERVESTPDQ